MRFISLFIILTALLFSKGLELDNLLKEYESSESLYKKTKRENAGYLLIYSREDLDKMQAYTLTDVLKTVRMYTMQVNSTGIMGMVNAGAGKASMPPIKLYIDDFEVSTAAQRNAFDMYGNMDIYFVDHIEIYQGGSSIEFGNQPGSMVVRLYSKDPSRENSVSVELSTSSKSDVNLRAVDAGLQGGYHYLLYASSSKTNFEKQYLNNKELSRDEVKYQAHFKIAQDDNFVVEADGIINKTDIYSGFGSAPTGGDVTRAYGYLSAIKYFPDNLQLSLSVSQEKKDISNTDEFGIRLTDATMSKDIHLHVTSNTYKTSIKKKVINGNNDLLIGAEFQKKSLTTKAYDGFNSNVEFGPDSIDIYMLFLEELYNINEDNLLAFSAKLDYYKDNFDKSSTEHSVRLGYTRILNDAWKTKIFATQRYVYPNMMQKSFAPPNYKVNPDLDSSYVSMISGELEYLTKKNRVVLGYAYKELEDTIALSKIEIKHVNLPDTVYFKRYYARVQHHFNIDNKIVAEIFRAYKKVYGSPKSGALIQVFNTFDKFNLYNELVYREGYTFDHGMGDIKTDCGYDYTVALSYNVDKRLRVKIKGENLLDKASKSVIDPQGTIQVSALEKRAILSIEYTY